MTPRQESNLELLVGQLKGEMLGLGASIADLKADMRNGLANVDQKLTSADEWRHEVKDRLEKMEAQGIHMAHVSDAFDALQQSIRDGRMQAKGVFIGIGVAGGAAGATVATGIKWVYAVFAGG